MIANIGYSDRRDELMHFLHRHEIQYSMHYFVIRDADNWESRGNTWQFQISDEKAVVTALLAQYGLKGTLNV